MSTPDPNLTRWGLHELQGSGYNNNNNNTGPGGVKAQYRNENENLGFASMPLRHIEPAPSTTSDALIAQALQEEFQRLDAAGAPGASAPPAQEQAAVVEQAWVEEPGSPDIDSSSEDEDDDESFKGGERRGGHVTAFEWNQVPNGESSSSSTFQDNASIDDGEEDDRQLALALAEDHPQVDQEVGRRLTKLESIKHVLRTNSIHPTREYASADHQRLSERLEKYGLREQQIKGDGNCQKCHRDNCPLAFIRVQVSVCFSQFKFRALSDQLFRNPSHHKYVRKSVVKQLKTTQEAYADYVSMDYAEYVKNMAKNGEWGDHVTLQAASDYYGVKIRLITSFKDTCFIEIVPTKEKSPREIYLSFWAEIHYNSIYPVGDDYIQFHSRQPARHRHGRKRTWLKEKLIGS